MSRKQPIRLSWLVLIAAASCLDPYNPPDVGGELNALVVEGFVNTSDNSAIVKLSRTSSLASTKPTTVEKSATVAIETIGSNVVNILHETAAGVYTGTGLSLDLSKKYRLRIKTVRSKSYVSDLVDFPQTPPIDSVFWEPSKDGVQIYATTHGQGTNTAYYKWDFVETWNNRAFWDPRYVIINGRVTNRPNAEKTQDCWTTQPSTKILVTSTENLSQNVVSRFPVLFIPFGSPKVQTKYSILLQQQVITPEAFTFWQQIQKTNESLGGLFDPLPSQVVGNVHNVADASELVLGYFSGGSIDTKRIFIDFFDLPDYLHPNPDGVCPLIEIFPESISSIPGPVLLIVAGPYYTADLECMDCRVTGGVLTKPTFWP